MSLVRCLAKLNAQLRDFNTGEVRDAAEVYRSRGREDRDANVAAIEDHLRDLKQQKAQTEKRVLDAWKERDPEGYAQAQRPALDLQGETDGEIRAREARQAKEADQQRRVANAPSEKGFTLTGSDRMVDEAEARGQKGMFTRTQESGGMAVEDVRQVVEPIVTKWTNAPDVNVIESMDKAPPSVRAEDQRQLAQGAGGKPYAFFHDGQVYLVASEIHSRRQAIEGLLHESLGHYGLRGVFGKSLEPLLAQIASGRREEVTAKAKAYGLDPLKREDRLTAAEEVLAELAQTRPELGIVKRAVAAVRNWMRERGLDVQWSDNDIIQKAIIPAREWVERGRGGAEASGAPTFHRAFHGSPHDFEEFSLHKIGTGEGNQAYGWGLYFAGDRAVADYYRKHLSDSSAHSRVFMKDGSELGENTPERHAASLLYYNDLREMRALGKRWLKEAEDGTNAGTNDVAEKAGLSPTEYWGRLNDFLQSHTRRDVDVRKGRLYEVELAPKLEDYLDLDKGIAAQNDAVRAVVRDMLKEDGYLRPGEDGPRQLNSAFHEWRMAHGGFGGGDTGAVIYSGLAKRLGGERQASEFLASKGVPGLRYLDGDSRAKGHGKYNFVIFDDKHVEVKAKFARASEANPEDVKDTPSKGKLFDSVKEVTKSWVDEIQKAVAPMAAGSDRARAVAKDYANSERLARYQWALYDQRLKKNFTPEQLKKMWEAADEENVLQQQGKSTKGKGLDTLAPEERAEVERMHQYANGLLAQAKDAGLFKGEGLPYWTPRMVAMIGKDGEFLTEPGKGEGTSSPFNSPTGRNISTSASSLKHREHLTTAETEAAAQAKFGADAQVVKDIRTMPLAMARLERAVAGRHLINAIRDIGTKAGEEIISSGEKPGFFTVDSPAFKTFRPKFEEVDGKQQPVTDSQGNVVFDKVPIYVAKEFEGPLKAIMSDKPGKIYSALMSLKAKTMGLIMYSPLIHNAVEWGRALPLMPGKVATFKIYFEGNAIRKDESQMREFIDAGLVPIGKRFQNQDISGIVEEPTLKPGRSLTAKALGNAVGAINAKAGEAVKRGVDAAGDFWHNTLLWDRVADLQMGIAANMRDYAMAKGLDRESALRVASHLANRYAGALPNEAMSTMARKVANISLFSRTFTLGNLGVMKDMVTGLPKDVQAQIRRDAGEIALKQAKSLAQKKAIHAFMLDIALLYAGNAALQSAFDYWRRDKSLSDIEKGYVDRFNRLLDHIKESPAQLFNVFGNLQSLSPTGGNEPGKEDRVLFGYAKDGTAIYVRLPTGKIGEEFKGWLTSPLDMLKRKESTIVRPTIQAFTNDKGFGRPVYDDKAKGLSGSVKAAGSIVWNYMSQQLPMDSVKAAGDLMKGRGDDQVNAYKVVGPLVGLTFSKGAPGGPAVGQLFEAEREHQAQVQHILPDVRELVQDGKRGEAIALMRENKMTPQEISITLRYATSPAARLNARRIQKFNEIATPDEIEAMRRLRQSSP